MRIIGNLNWFRPHIPNLSQKNNKLTDKLKSDKNKRFSWSNEDEENLHNLKQEIYKVETFVFPNYDEEFLLECDASEIGIGCILKEKQGIIAIYSKKFTKVVSNSTMPEKEVYAIFLGLKQFRPYIFGS